LTKSTLNRVGFGFLGAVGSGQVDAPFKKLSQACHGLREY